MHPFDFPPLPLEGGVAPLKQLYKAASLCPKEPLDRAYMMLLAGACHHALEAKSSAMADADGETRRQLSLLQRMDMSAAAQISCLQKSQDTLESAMLHAFLSLESCAAFAMRLGEGPVRRALYFVIPELLDALYRLSNASVLLGGPSGQAFLDCRAEIMPGRPLIACHRHPYDETAEPAEEAAPEEIAALHAALAALNAQRTFCLHALPALPDPDAQALLAEIACVAQGHATRFACLQPGMPPLRRALWAQYTCAFLFYSRAETEMEPNLRASLEAARDHACNQLRKLSELAGDPALPEFPAPLALGHSKGCVRDTLEYLGETAKRTGYAPVGSLAPGADFFRYQRRVCGDENAVPSHRIIRRMIEKRGSDDRFEIAPHPVEALRSRTRDNTHIAR